MDGAKASRESGGRRGTRPLTPVMYACARTGSSATADTVSAPSSPPLRPRRPGTSSTDLPGLCCV